MSIKLAICISQPIFIYIIIIFPKKSNIVSLWYSICIIDFFCSDEILIDCV